MNNLRKDITKGVTTEFAGSAIEIGFTALATAAGFPAAAIVMPLAKGIVLGLVQNCFNDCAQMTLSMNEKKKLNRVSSVALQTFWELAEKDGVVAWEMSIDPAYIDYAYEVAEHSTLEAIRQSEKEKVDILGRLYGKQFYKGESDWQDMHQMINMVSSLTLRQLVLIRLISEGFEGIDNTLLISNPSACVEVNGLRDYGIWQTEGASWGVNESWLIKLSSLIPTIYSDTVCDALMLDRLSDNDIKRVIDSLRLTSEGEAQGYLTKQDFERRFRNLVYAEPVGTIDVASPPHIGLNK